VLCMRYVQSESLFAPLIEPETDIICTGKLGHISRDCTAPNGGPLNTAGKTCYQ
jgi:hypothetical protein